MISNFTAFNLSLRPYAMVAEASRFRATLGSVDRVTTLISTLASDDVGATTALQRSQARAEASAWLSAADPWGARLEVSFPVWPGSYCSPRFCFLFEPEGASHCEHYPTLPPFEALFFHSVNAVLSVDESNFTDLERFDSS